MGNDGSSTVDVGFAYAAISKTKIVDDVVNGNDAILLRRLNNFPCDFL